jgi:hypothetical protein
LNGDPIRCEEIIIRLIGRKRDFLDGEIAAAAFILRPNDGGKLSFFRKSISDLPICRAALQNLYGAGTLHTGRVRSASYPSERKLDVVEAEGEGTDILGHVAMIGLPDPETEFEAAERVASILQKQSRAVRLDG